ncbi:hypothetical protein BDQ12DRAFT_159805 [Crucibulum laeve]|uniref:Uncharacterized protein n=1 Tax=Crucibulum laeve TaxID=68775 RepID=A0A5C3LXI2_9AGAR|nr:hypothetical protein BDQ12DRAFT_159805 [Crucibulum laeve]
MLSLLHPVAPSKSFVIFSLSNSHHTNSPELRVPSMNKPPHPHPPLPALFLLLPFTLVQRTIAKGKELEPLLETTMSALVVLVVVGVMFECLLHAYNASAQPTSASFHTLRINKIHHPDRNSISIAANLTQTQQIEQTTTGSRFSLFSSLFPSLPSRNSRLG